MPRIGGLARVLAVALVVSGYAAAEEESIDSVAGEGKGYDHVDLSVDSGGNTGQDQPDVLVEGAEDVVGGDAGYDHVDFSMGEADDASGDDKGDGHVDLSIDDGTSTVCGERGNGHVDLSIDGSDSSGSDKDEGHVDLCVDPAGAYTIEADLVPGTGGAEICGFDGGGESVHVDFRITIRADGRVGVNGQELATCDPAKGCRITLAWCPGTGALVVQVDDASGALCAGQYSMDGAPEGVCISAAEVRSLSVLRQ